MLISWGAPTLQGSDATGEVVSSRKVRFGSQPEQIMYLRGIVNAYCGVNAIRQRARDIVFRQRQCPPKDQVRQALAIAGWVQDNITYVAEEPEVFQTPTLTVAQGYGDCDDMTTLIASMCQSIGIDNELVGMEWPDNFGKRYYQHIFPRAVIPQRGYRARVPLDASLTAPVEDMRDPLLIARKALGNSVKVFVA